MSPKQNDSDDLRRGEGELLRFSANVDCPECGSTFEQIWTDDSMTVEDMVDAPVATAHCEECGHEWEAEYEGWMIRSEA